MNNLGVVLFWSCVQISLVTATAAVAYLLLGRNVARMRGQVLQITFVLTLVLSALVFSPWPRWRAVAPAGDETPRVVHTHTGNYIDGILPTDMDTNAAADPAAGPVNPSDGWLDTAWRALRELNGASLLPTFALIVLAGLVIGTCRCLAGVAAVRWMARAAGTVTDESLLALLRQLREELGYRGRVQVRESDRLSAPATVGWRTPLILLPKDWRGWSGAERRAVLAHELAHIVRRDFAGLVVAQISSALHFYHPLMHWLLARLRLEQELVADAMAARVAGGRTAYLTVLATMALRMDEQPMGWPARSFLPTRGTFLRRIEMLRDSRETTGRVRGMLATAALAAVVVIGVVASGLRSQDVKPPDVRTEETAKSQRTSQDNLKMLGLAFHSYHEKHGHFPPAAVAGQHGQKHSWRVALLPFLDRQDLYDQYRFDEPWDSAANRQVLKQMPDIYRAPLDDQDSTHASYFVFAGKGTPFSGDEGARVSSFLDGTSNTILVVEVKKEVPWTKPEDIAYPPSAIEGGKPPFTGWYDDRLMTMLADGSARAFPIQLDQKVSQALIEIADGTVIDWSTIPNPSR
jgi:beta-lactamase regulating signal transducer with metallopeptidase domain